MFTSKYLWFEVSEFHSGSGRFFTAGCALPVFLTSLPACFGPVGWKLCEEGCTTAFFCFLPAEFRSLFLPGDLLFRLLEPDPPRSLDADRILALGFWFLIVMGAGYSPGKIALLSPSTRKASCSVAKVTLFSAIRRATLVCSSLKRAGKLRWFSEFKFSSRINSK